MEPIARRNNWRLYYAGIIQKKYLPDIPLTLDSFDACVWFMQEKEKSWITIEFGWSFVAKAISPEGERYDYNTSMGWFQRAIS